MCDWKFSTLFVHSLIHTHLSWSQSYFHRIVSCFCSGVSPPSLFSHSSVLHTLITTNVLDRFTLAAFIHMCLSCFFTCTLLLLKLLFLRSAPPHVFTFSQCFPSLWCAHFSLSNKIILIAALGCKHCFFALWWHLNIGEKLHFFPLSFLNLVVKCVDEASDVSFMASLSEARNCDKIYKASFQRTWLKL